MSALIPALGFEFIEDAGQLLRDANDLTNGENGEYLRDGNPQNLFQRLPLEMARQGCRRYADKPNNYTAARTARTERACRPYLDDLQYGDGPTLELPFRGGQCSNVFYRIAFSFTNSFGNSQTLEQVAMGPLQGVWTEPDGNGNTRAGYFESDGAGNKVKQIQTTTNAPFQPSPSLAILFRIDGQPDNCGNVPPEYTPPKPPIGGPGPRVQPITIAPNVDIDIDLEINIDGSFDINIGTGPVTIDPFGDPPPGGGEPGGGGEDPGGGAPPPGDVGQPGDGAFAGPGGDAEGEAPPGTVLTGLKLVLGNRPASPSQYKAGIFRGGAYIYMGTETGLDMDYAGQMLAENQFVFAEKDFLTHWKVSANLGYSWAVTPYYREV
jgi:hypothetical protein